MKKRILKLKEKIKAKKDSKRIPRPVEKQIQLGEPIITVNNLIKDFKTSRGTVHALKGITFDIYSGQNIGFVGGNGAGKTTTVEILLGLNKPTSGSINFLWGHSLIDIHKNLGIQFQDSLYPNNISVKSIVEFIIAAYGATITKEELNEMLDLFQIKSFYKNNASSLSGGQSQRLNILLALMHKPKVVFLDELSTGLDITTRNSIKVFIKNYTKKHGMTVVLVSHDVSEIIYLCDRILVYREGTIVSDRMIKEFNNDVPKLEEFISNMIKNKPEKID